jgi:hypothetical protein
MSGTLCRHVSGIRVRFSRNLVRQSGVSVIMSGVRFERFRWSILAASVALMTSCGSATGPRADAPTHAASGVPTASAKDQIAVTRFIERLRSEHVDFEPAADWSAGRLTLAVPDPTSEPWPDVEGQVVGGLQVTVLHATVSTAEYEHSISAIGRARFVDRARVESFDYPTDGSHIIVRVRGLHHMDATRRADLAANLERVADVPVRLINAPHTVPLPAIVKN